MGLKTGSGTITGGDGVFIEVCRVTKIRNFSGEPAMEGWTPRDCSIEIHYESTEKEQDFDTSMYILGDFKKDEHTNEVIDWGQAFKISRFFESLGVSGEELNSDNSIPDEWLTKAIGKEFVKLSYVSNKVNPNTGKNRWRTWDIVATANGNLEKSKTNLAKQFKDSVKRGYPKDVRTEEDDFSFGNNVAATTTTTNTDTVVDDL